MKRWCRFFALFLAVVLCVSAFPVAVSALDLTDSASVERIEVLQPPEKTQYVQELDGWQSSRYDEASGEEIPYFYYDIENYRSGLMVEVFYTDGTSGVYAYDEIYDNYFEGAEICVTTTQEETPWELGFHTVTVAYLGKEASFEVEVVENPVERIEIVSVPDKTTYVEGIDGDEAGRWDEELGDMVPYFHYGVESNWNGLAAEVFYTDGTSKIYDYDEVWDSNFEGAEFRLTTTQYDSPWELGSHTVTVEYMGKTAEFSVEVVENPVERIEILRVPDQITYVEAVDGYETTRWDGELGEEVPYFHYDAENNREGLKTEIFYTDGTSKIYDYDASYDYDFEGIPVELTTTQPSEPWEIGSHTVTVEYLGKEASFEVEVVENPVESISVSKLPEKTVYYQEIDGQWIDSWNDETQQEETYYYFYTDFTGLEVTVSYRDGTSRTIAYDPRNTEFEGYEFWVETFQSVSTPWETGEQPVFVKYCGRETSFTVEVAPSPVTSIEFVRNPEDSTYYAGEIPSFEGARLRVHYEDGTQEEISLTHFRKNASIDSPHWLANSVYSAEGKIICNWDWEEDRSLKPGTNEVTLRYGGKTAKLTVTAQENPISGFEVLADPYGDDGKGLILRLTRSDGGRAEWEFLDTASVFVDGDVMSGGLYSGCARTEDGIFPYEFYCEYDRDADTGRILDMTSYRVTMFGETVPVAEPGPRYRIAQAANHAVATLVAYRFTPEFDGTVNRSNIDTLLYIARMQQLPGLIWPGEQQSGETLRRMVQEAFTLSDVDLTLSENYDPETDMYTFPARLGGVNGSPVWGMTALPDGSWRVQCAAGNGEGDHTVYVWMTGDGKIMRFSESPEEEISLATPEVKAEPVSYNSIRISWNAVEGADGYLVYRQNDKGKWARIPAVKDGTTELSFTDTGLETGKPYTYTVKAYRKVGDKTVYGDYPSGTSAKTALAEMPPVKAASASYNSIKLSWQKIAGASGYLVYRKDSAGKWQRLEKLSGGSVLTYTDTGLTTGKTYTYTVKAYRTVSGGEVYSRYSASGTSCQPVLKTPVVKAVPASATSIRVSWNRIAGAQGYLVYRKNSAGKWERIKTVTDGATLTFTDSGRKTGASETYTVKAYRKVGTKTVYGGYPSGTSCKLALGTPVVKAAPADARSITVSWNQIPGAQGYLVYRKNSAGRWERIKTVTGGTTLRCTDTGLTTGKTYTYTVKAYWVTGGKKAYGAYPSGTDCALTLAKPILKSAAGTSTTSIQVKWGSVSGAEGYDVYRKTAGGGWSRIGTVKSGSTTAFTDRTAARGTSYLYTVRAYWTVNGKLVRSAYDTKGISGKTK